MKKIVTTISLVAVIFTVQASQIILEPLKKVVPNAKCIFIGKVLKADTKKLKNGSRIELLVAPTKVIRGKLPQAVKITLTYTEVIPAIVDESGKVVGHLSPILSGSGKEFTVKKGESWIFLLSSEKTDKILRLEPSATEKEIKNLISQQSPAGQSPKAAPEE